MQHPTTDQLEEVQILLDTGADESFNQYELAENLQLPVLRTIDLTMYTFGEREPKQKQYDITKARIWDRQNHSIDLTLHKTGVISASGKKIKLSSADKEHLAKEEIYLSNKQGSVIGSKIPLGCDQLSNLIKFSCKEYTLPSGLRIIPSRLGYLLTGQRDSEDKQDANGTCNLVESDYDLPFQSRNERQIEGGLYFGAKSGKLRTPLPPPETMSPNPPRGCTHPHSHGQNIYREVEAMLELKQCYFDIDRKKREMIISQNTMERIIEDQLNSISNAKAAIHARRATLQSEEKDLRESSQAKITESIESMKSAIEEIVQNIGNPPTGLSRGEVDEVEKKRRCQESMPDEEPME
ncbi:hypothetical protein GCK32_022074, partial [Trichostrongylus colubriformis]